MLRLNKVGWESLSPESLLGSDPESAWITPGFSHSFSCVLFTVVVLLKSKHLPQPEIMSIMERFSLRFAIFFMLLSFSPVTEK